MSALSGYGKYKRYVKTDSGYKLCSQWTSSNTVHFDDGKTAQTKLDAIDGITDSLTATNSRIALSAAAGKSLQDQITSLNTDKVTNFSADTNIVGLKWGGSSINFLVDGINVGGISSGLKFLTYEDDVTTMTALLKNLSAPCLCITSTEYVSDKPTGKYGTIVIFKLASTRAAAICVCTDGTLYTNAWNTTTSAVAGWKEK